jgi:hypothetical protein
MSCISRWAQNCLQNHPGCVPAGATTSQSWYPTRLLDLSTVPPTNEETVRLVISANNPPKGSYVTLSHCWGDTNIVKLISKTLVSFCQGLELSTLPTTFQHAIAVTRSLGFQYLWIDSLCIIQDSKSDWEREAPTMIQVYQNLIINISAIQSTNSNGGLFVQRNPNTLTPPCIQLSFPNNHKQNVKLSFIHYWKDEVEQAPLTTRAWVVQERILSPRIVHFGREEVFWECKEHAISESFPRTFPRTNYLARYLTVSNDPFTTRKHVSQKSKIEHLLPLRPWFQIISSYSKANLTYWEDRLVALAGVVRLFENVLDDKFYAGIWRKNLVFRLAWNVDYDTQGTSLQSVLRPGQPDANKFPSWSWLLLVKTSISPPHLNEENFWTNGAVSELASVLDVKLISTKADNTLQMSGGHIRLHCILTEVTIKCIRGRYWEIYLNDKKIEFSNLRLDLEQGTKDIHCFYLPLYDNLTDKRTHGIIVQSTNAAVGEYQRIGCKDIHGGLVADDARLPFKDPAGKGHIPCEMYDPSSGHIIILV